ncbi:hypothetical protein, partial [Desulfovibrio sp. TomC]|uniref:hypothetical protein n=1 Tax=Desulfovibrio sp. TomC TaxID=1562888 RepID=UPI001E3B9404
EMEESGMTKAYGNEGSGCGEKNVNVEKGTGTQEPQSQALIPVPNDIISLSIKPRIINGVSEAGMNAFTEACRNIFSSFADAIAETDPIKLQHIVAVECEITFSLTPSNVLFRAVPRR